MTSAEVIAGIRRGLREPLARRIGATAISQAMEDAINIIAIMLVSACPERFQKRVTLQSSTHVFALPSDLHALLSVWDIDTNAKSVTGATNATPIVITSAAHGFEDDDIVTIHDVAGNTAANGTWKVANAATNTFELYGSVGNAAYTSGGKIFKETVDFILMTKINPKDSEHDSGDSPYRYFIRGTDIVVDDLEIDSDLLINYRYLPTSLTDIPEQFHFGIVSYGVVTLMELPKPDDPEFPDLVSSHKLHQGLWKMAQEQIMAYRPSPEPEHRSDYPRWRQWI
jgi:hypothetical protein